ncbi:MAG: ABC transporter substrate-binding protein [Limnospira sp.]
MPYPPQSIRRRRFLLLLGTSLTLSVWACRPASQTPPDITIGVIAPLSGELAATAGQATLRGAELAVSEVNEAGGLEVGNTRQKVALAIADDRDSPDEAVAAATRLINEKNVVALVGLPLSRIAIPVADLAERAGIPTVSSWSTNPQTTAGKEYIFRVAFTDDFQGQVIARFASENLEATTAAVLYDIASDYNRGLAEIFKQEFEGFGGQVVAFESYTTDQRDFGVQLRQIRDSGAEILFLPNYDNEVPRQARQGRELGITARLMGSDTWGGLSSIEHPELEGAFFTDHWNIAVENSTAQSFIETYQKIYGSPPESAAALSYDATRLVLTAIRNQGRADPESIRDGLAKIEKYEGVTGTLQFQGNGDPLRSVVVLQFQSGKPVLYDQVNPEFRSVD